MRAGHDTHGTRILIEPGPQRDGYRPHASDRGVTRRACRPEDVAGSDRPAVDAAQARGQVRGCRSEHDIGSDTAGQREIRAYADARLAEPERGAGAKPVAATGVQRTALLRDVCAEVRAAQGDGAVVAGHELRADQRDLESGGVGRRRQQQVGHREAPRIACAGDRHTEMAVPGAPAVLDRRE